MTEDMEAGIKLSSKYESLVRQQLQKETMDIEENVRSSDVCSKDNGASAMGSTDLKPGAYLSQTETSNNGPRTSGSEAGTSASAPSSQLRDTRDRVHSEGKRTVDDAISDSFHYSDTRLSSEKLVSSNGYRSLESSSIHRREDVQHSRRNQGNIEDWLANSANPCAGQRSGYEINAGEAEPSFSKHAEDRLLSNNFLHWHESANGSQIPHNASEVVDDVVVNPAPRPVHSSDAGPRRYQGDPPANGSNYNGLPQNSSTQQRHTDFNGLSQKNSGSALNEKEESYPDPLHSSTTNGYPQGPSSLSVDQGSEVRSGGIIYDSQRTTGDRPSNGLVTGYNIQDSWRDKYEPYVSAERLADRRTDMQTVTQMNRDLSDDTENIYSREYLGDRRELTRHNDYSSLPLEYSRQSRKYEIRRSTHRNETSDSMSLTTTDYLPDQSEEQMRQLRREKEILAGEVVKLRERIEDLGGDQASTLHLSSSINTYEPNSPQALQRKIVELEGQIQDLQEANESAVMKLERAERKIAELEKQNRALASSSDISSINHKMSREWDPLPGNHYYGDRSFSSNVESHELQRELRDRSKSHDSLRQDWDRQGIRGYPSTRQETHHYRSSHEEKRKLDSSFEGQGRIEKLEEESARHREELGVRDSQIRPAYTRPSQRLPQPPGDRLQRPSSAHGYLDRSATRETSDRYHQYPLPHSTSTVTRMHLSGRQDRSPSQTQTGYRDEDEWARGGDREHGLSPRSTGSEFRHLPHLTPPRYRGDSERYSKSRQRPGYGNPAEPVPHLSPQRYPAPDGDDTARSTALSDCSDSTAALVYTSGGSVPPPSHLSHEQPRTHYRHHTSGLSNLPEPRSGHVDTDDLSDTETEVLLSNLPPSRQSPPSRQARPRQTARERAMDTDKSVLKRRSRSLDFRDMRGSPQSRPVPQHGMSPSQVQSERSSLRFPSTERLSEATDHPHMTPDPSTSVGFRTVSPPPINTQRNKPPQRSQRNALMNSTAGLKPFAPRSPNDIQLGDVVKFSRQGGKISRGCVKYVGHLPGRGDIYLGVELERDEGKHDGVFEGVRYFQCKPNKAVFVAFNKVVMAWANPEVQVYDTRE